MADYQVENYHNALEHIRLAATMHYFGGAFEPEHMRAIANLCIRALNDEDVPALPSPEDIHARAVLRMQQIAPHLDDDEYEYEYEDSDGEQEDSDG